MTKNFISFLTLLSIGCGGLTFLATPPPTLVIEPTRTASPYPSPTLIAIPTQTLYPTDTATVPPSPTLVPTDTFTPTLTSEPPRVMQGPNEVIVPILLYHHIGIPQGASPYYVSPTEFERQMFLLREWGYRTISVELLVRAIKQGAELPPKPVILTFDDGSATAFRTALPIMQKYGFTGTVYIVYNYIGISGYMNVDQIRAMHAAGWEIGSHSTSHVDLTIRSDRQKDEIVDSRSKLQALLEIPILTFAYPFGAYNSDSVHYAHFAGYIAAVGLGNESLQGNKNLFYLYRMAVNGNQSLESFALLLPWRGDLTNLPEMPIVP
ncbi:MAG TPA: polysaccharide deacetylase family protein [Anaerolineales bacterium]|nr:polysaccharide deacetylase family protein [Anaerolineales bacterium]